MTDSLNSRKPVTWKRSLIGGVFSGLNAGATILVFYLMPNVVSGFFGMLFLVPAYIVESIIGVVTSNEFKLNEWVGAVISIFLWSIVGAALAYYFKKSKVAIGCWFLLYFLSFPIGVVVFLLKTTP